MKMSGVLPLPASAPRHLIASSSPFPPYEWGGYWFGGKEGVNVGGHNAYEGYGMDCSGLVSNGALRAGYNWHPWRATTSTLTNEFYSTSIDPRTLQPGDILLKPGEHVVTLFNIDTITRGVPDKIEVISSEDRISKKEGLLFLNGVAVIKNDNFQNNLKYYLDNDYETRRLVRR